MRECAADDFADARGLVAADQAREAYPVLQRHLIKANDSPPIDYRIARRSAHFHPAGSWIFSQTERLNQAGIRSVFISNSLPSVISANHVRFWVSVELSKM